jgi:hypothetical protein
MEVWRKEENSRSETGGYRWVAQGRDDGRPHTARWPLTRSVGGLATVRWRTETHTETQRHRDIPRGFWEGDAGTTARTSCVAAMEQLSQWVNAFLLRPPVTQCVAQQRQRGNRLAPLELNLVCIGRKGLGKTSAIEMLFGVSAHTTGTVTHRAQLVHADDQSAEISLRVTDGPGFADDKDAQDQVQRLQASIKAEMRQYAFAQKTLSHHQPDEAARDPRTHLVLFFVPPGELPDFDRKAIDALLPCANVAVIAAKADSMVPDELARYKQEVSRQLDDSSSRQRRRREGRGITTEEPYMPFGGITMDAPRSSPVLSPVFAVIGKERRYSNWRVPGTATPTDSDCTYYIALLAAVDPSHHLDVLITRPLHRSTAFARADIVMRGH